MAKRCPSCPVLVAAVDPHLLRFMSLGVKHALDDRPAGEHWLMSFVSSEMAAAAAAAAMAILSALSQDGATVQCFICEMCTAHMCEAEHSVSASNKSPLLLSANWCLRRVLTISENLWKVMAGASVNQSSHCPICSDKFRATLFAKTFSH